MLKGTKVRAVKLFVLTLPLLKKMEKKMENTLKTINEEVLKTRKTSKRKLKKKQKS